MNKTEAALDSEEEPARPRRKVRADGVRNRERLIEAAKEAFTVSGSEASLEEIARRAAVGIGTLYRHFPTREAMVEAVYRREVQQMADAAESLLASSPPLDALRAWMRLFISYVSTKRLIAPALSNRVGGAADLYAASGLLITGAVTRLVQAAQSQRAMAPDVEPGDVIRALVGFTVGNGDPKWEMSARRLIDILIEGLRAQGELSREKAAP